MPKKPTSRFNRFTNPLGVVSSAAKKSQKTVSDKVSDKLPFLKKITRKQAKKGALITLAALAVLFVGMIVVFSFDLPNPGEIAQYKPVGSTKILDRNGKLLYDIHDEVKRNPVESANIPLAAKDAIVAIEDKDFYQHHGVDFRGIARSIYVNITRASKAQGASTITQQLARNAITNIGTKKSFVRKIREIITALNFERVYSKDQILTLYLNQVSFSNNNYGIETASTSYYGKSIKDLDPELQKNDDDKAKAYARIAMLVSLPQSPSYYNPYGVHTDTLEDRRNIVLRKMQQQGKLSEELTKKAQAVAIDDGLIAKRDSIQAPHFVFYIKEQLVDLLGGGQEGETRLETGGYKITTTLDLDLQNQAEQIIAKDSPAIFKNTNASNAALVSIDATNGQILAMVGSADFSNKTFGSVNVTTSERQPGSSFKPLVYASLFKKGWSPGSTIFDLEGYYDQSKPNEIWPHNYSGGGRGPVTVRNALAQSLNISAAKAQALAGTKESIDTAKDLGVSTLNSPDQYGLSMVLGAAEVKMVDMVGAYATFANNGVHHDVSGILKVEDNNGQVIKEWKDETKKVLDDFVAYEITSILMDDQARAPAFGSRSALTLPDRPVAAKTGTTSNYRDAWTIGFTPQIATAVWVGNNNNKEMTHSGAGAMAAAPIWHDYMVAANKNLEKKDFTRPDSVKDCTLSKYSNKKPTQYTADVVRDICADGQIPKDDDDGYKAVKLYKPDQTKLATDDTPLQLVETKVFRIIHSERPNDPVWEGPVQNWARAAGISIDSIPTEKYDPNAANDKLSISITSPSNGATVSGTITLQATASSKFGVSLMTYYIDEKQISQPNAPWNVSFDTHQLSDGKHTFKAVAKDLQDQENSASISFTSNNASPITVSGVTATRSVDQKSVTITWQTSLASDGLVEYGTTTAYGTNATEGRGLVTSHTITIFGLDIGTTYHFMITSKNGASSGKSVDSTF